MEDIFDHDTNAWSKLADDIIAPSPITLPLEDNLSQSIEVLMGRLWTLLQGVGPADFDEVLKMEVKLVELFETSLFSVEQIKDLSQKGQIVTTYIGLAWKAANLSKEIRAAHEFMQAASADHKEKHTSNVKSKIELQSPDAIIAIAKELSFRNVDAISAFRESVCIELESTNTDCEYKEQIPPVEKTVNGGSTVEVIAGTTIGAGTAPLLAFAFGFPGILLALTGAGIGYFSTKPSPERVQFGRPPTILKVVSAAVKSNACSDSNPANISGDCNEGKLEVRMLQHQRCYFGAWSNALLPTDVDCCWTTHQSVDNVKKTSSDAVSVERSLQHVPKFNPVNPHNVALPSGYRYASKSWRVYCHDTRTDPHGWVYALSFAHSFHPVNEFLDNVRTRYICKSVSVCMIEYAREVLGA